MGGVNKNVHAKRLAQASEVLVILQADGSVTSLTSVACIPWQTIFEHERVVAVATICITSWR